MNKTRKTLILSAVIIVTLSLAVSGVGFVSAQPDETSPSKRWRQARIIEQIGEEAAQALRDTVQSMREAGDSFEEIRTYVREYLINLGVELPEPKGEGFRNGEGMKHRGFTGRKRSLHRYHECPEEIPNETSGTT